MKQPLHKRETVCFHVDQNNGQLSIKSNRTAIRVGFYICLPLYSRKAANLLSKIKLTSGEVEPLIKI